MLYAILSTCSFNKSNKITLKDMVGQILNVLFLHDRAWIGDQEAAAQVGTIIGAAPPDIEIEETEEGNIITSKPKVEELVILRVY
jgi:hypothetical protein